MGIVVFILIALTFPLLAEEPNSDLAKFIRFDKIGIAEGLSQSSVREIFQDSEGFIWFGTQDGLDRYDGYSFLHFPVAETPGEKVLSGKLINGMTEDEDGNLWVATGNGLTRLSGKNYQSHFYYHDPLDQQSISSNDCRSVFIDSTGQLWLVTAEGVNRYHEESDSFEMIAFSDPGYYNQISEQLYEVDGELLLLNLDNRPARYNPETNQFEPVENEIFSTIYVESIHEDDSSIYFAGYKNTIARYNKETGEVKYYDNENVGELSLIMKMAHDTQGRHWAISRDGSVLIKYPGSDSFEIVGSLRHSIDEAISIPLMELHIDRSGVVWIGSNGGGAAYFSPYRRKFGLISPASSASIRSHGAYVYALHQEGDDLWVGSYDHGLERIDLTTGEAINLNIESRKGNLQYGRSSFFNDALGRLWWIPTNNLAYLIDREGNQFRRFELPHGITAVSQLESGEVLIGSTGNILYLFSSSQDLFKFERAEEIRVPLAYATTIHEAANGSIWIGGENGLTIWDRNDQRMRIHQPGQEEGEMLISNARVKEIVAHSSGVILVGTMGGLAVFSADGEIIRTFQAPEFLPNDAIYAIEEDYAGRLWLATNRGLLRLDMETEELEHFVNNDGLQNNEFNTQASTQSEDGTLYFGGISGISYFEPESLPSNRIPPKIAITSFKVMGREKTLKELPNGRYSIELPYDQNYISVSFAALDFTMSEMNQFKYRLGGSDAEFQHLGNHHTLNLELSPGRNLLEIAGTNNDGIWSLNTAQVVIRIHPSFLRTPLFLGLMLGSIALVLVGLLLYNARQNKRMRERLAREVSIKTKALAETNKELEAFNYMVSHDLQTPLMNLNHYMHLLKDADSTSSGVTAEQIHQRVRKIIMGMRRLVSDLLIFSRSNATIINKQQLNIYMIALEIVNDLRETNPDSVIQFEGERDVEIYADPDFLPIAVRNILGNTEKYAPDKTSIRIVLSVETTENMHVIRFADNGERIADSMKEDLFKPFIRDQYKKGKTGTGIGLAIVERIINRHNGRVWIEDSEIGGTTIAFTLPRKS